MFEIVLVVHVVLAVLLVLSILIQHGKGADAGVAFGSSSTSDSAFGASGANSFLYKASVTLAVSFFTTSLLLAYLASSQNKVSNINVESVIKTQPTDIKKPVEDNKIPVK
ncbi:Preprotein translocase subunit SecG (TC 3.A.5.1.1) [hydrothermal vent metagenome]|uniref:Preprotein translocase subunit SecG (TC 3.A.5.1.1) n=1 Tax=hydrothermal vent metagenome TaxID=652676 RepID=A0A1W1CWI1_9ZZZZ